MATKIYTKTGDDGTTGLFGGTRVRKDNARIEAYGTVDELNAVIGVVRTLPLPAAVEEQLALVSSTLFTLGADLATPLSPPPTYNIPRIASEHIAELEGWIDRFDGELSPLKTFILPGGTPAAAHLHLARTVCRRAERCIVVLAAEEEIGDLAVRYVNRLSDYLFVAARFVNAWAQQPDVPWTPQT